MDKKGFSLVELLGSLALLGIILCIGLYFSGGTLATTLSTLNNVSLNEINDAALVYVVENGVNWINDGSEYTCVSIESLVNLGYFEEEEVSLYKDEMVKLVRNIHTKVISSEGLVEKCE